MEYANPDALVSTEWLADHMDAPDIRIIDASMILPGMDRNAEAEYEEHHIPGAVRFNVDDISDSDSGLPHMLPSPEKFSSKVRKLGLGDGVRIVAYDSFGGYLAAMRAWWMFRVFGHNDIAVLDGGLGKWTDENRPTESGTPIIQERHFTARMDNTLVRSADQMLANIETKREQVIDARSPERFTGKDSGPRPGLHEGHIPGSKNLPFPKVMNPNDHFTLRSADEIAAAFDTAGIDRTKPLSVSCGSGVTACVPTFAMYLLGHDDTAVYDGSWAEWGDREDLPFET